MPNVAIWSGARRVRVVCAIVAACAACGHAPSPRVSGAQGGQRFLAESTASHLTHDPALRDVLLSGALVGQEVHVIGRCVGPRPRELGAAPRPDSWQLEADGVAIYVIGAEPRECAAGRRQLLGVMALVAEDTLPAIGELPPAPRRYLMQIGVELK